MNHFLNISDLTATQVEGLIKKALSFKKEKKFPVHNAHSLANLFYENSTRTRASFEMAAHRLSIPTLNLALEHSSERKGESMEDTMANLAAMGIDIFVIRHSQEGIPQQMALAAPSSVHVINAGDGKHAHPTQAMLDLMTIREKKSSLTDLNIAIVGDVQHSRVANSLQCLFSLMGVNTLRLISPATWAPKQLYFGQVTDSLEEGLHQADVIIALRVQKERLLEHEQLDLVAYHRDYGLTEDKLAWAKPDVIVMHPGPMNRGIEIDSKVADGPHSVILQQVNNGVYMRMAIIDSLLGDL